MFNAPLKVKNVLKNEEEDGEKSTEEMGMKHDSPAAQVVGESKKYHCMPDSESLSKKTGN